MKYKGILYDMDGTVLNTLEDLADAVNHILSIHGYPERNLTDIAVALGNGSLYLIRKCLPKDAPEGTAEKLLEEYLPYYREHCRIKTRPYDGITDMMTRLREMGARQAIISNKPDAPVKALAREYFPSHCELAVGEIPGIAKKPAPDMVQRAMAEMGLTKEECVYIGDTEVDIETAAAAGLDCITVTWGFRSKASLIDSGAVVLADTVEELLSLLL